MWHWTETETLSGLPPPDGVWVAMSRARPSIRFLLTVRLLPADLAVDGVVESRPSLASDASLSDANADDVERRRVWVSR